MRILGIETSCDETSAAVLIDGVVRSNIISSQLVHTRYGGVVPELASRAHQRLIIPVVEEALRVAGIGKSELNGIAVTYGPGLVGALLVGLNFAKSFAYGLNIPYVGVHHIEAHIYANLIDEPKPAYPFLCLIVSGGHTQLMLVEKAFEYRLIGETLDDAAGEAYDKVAKMLGLGFPGGPMVDRLAAEGDPKFVRFPRSYLGDDNFDFSFSGIKTSMLYWLRNHGYLSGITGARVPEGKLVNDLCASFQASVVEVLVRKTTMAAKKFNIHDVAIAGGVSANSALRSSLREAGAENDFNVFIPKPEYCTDNAAMIAHVGWMKLWGGLRSGLELGATATLPLGEPCG